jgi:nucleotide-binding universal stress UspA family protein
MITLKNILVATDFSEPSEAALLYGQALARTFKASLHVMHVVDTVSSVVYGAEAYAASIPEMQQEIEDSARKQLAELVIDNDEHALPTRRAADVACAGSHHRRVRQARGDRPHRDRYTWTRWRGTLADGQRCRTGRSDRAVPGADGPPSRT